MIKPGVKHYLGEGLFVSHQGGKITVRALGEWLQPAPAAWYCLLASIKRAA